VLWPVEAFIWFNNGVRAQRWIPYQKTLTIRSLRLDACLRLERAGDTWKEGV